MFTPPPSQMRPGDRSGIIAFHHQVSDDGRFALVEIVAARIVELAPVLTQIRALLHGPDVQVFERGKQTLSDVEKAFKAKRRDFDMSQFRVMVP